jgi:hypothetical protein
MCEGIVTEPKYFAGWRHETRNTLVTIEIVGEGVGPKVLVERAVEKKRAAEAEARRSRDAFARYEEVWCVFDVDQHGLIAEARQQAAANGLRVCISNPCFEIWLLLHYQDHRQFIERHQAAHAFREYVPHYVKEVPFQLIRPNYEEAVNRAAALRAWQQAQGCPGRNPCTDVDMLTELLRQLDRDQIRG